MMALSETTVTSRCNSNTRSTVNGIMWF